MADNENADMSDNEVNLCCSDMIEDDEDFLALVTPTRPAQETPLVLDKLRTEQGQDDDLMQVKTWKIDNYTPSSFDLAGNLKIYEFLHKI